MAPADGLGMSSAPNPAPSSRPAEAPDAFLHRSFRLLDAGQHRAWLALWSDPVSYIVTSARNVERGYEVAIINDDRDRLNGRIQSIEKLWHAEKPPTRTRHMVTNLECEWAADDAVRYGPASSSPRPGSTGRFCLPVATRTNSTSRTAPGGC